MNRSLDDQHAKHAAERALEEHGGWLRSVVLARSGDPGAVDEIVQEVALAVVRSGNRPSNSSEMGPWLFRVAVRQSLLHRRRLGRRARLERNYANNGCAPSDSGSPDPLEWLVSEERRRLVRRALAHLPRRDAEVLLLKYAEGWSYRRIAEYTDATPSAVEARLHRARSRLRSRLVAQNVIET